MNSLIEPARTPLDLNFRLLGTRVRVSAWFWVVPGVIGLFAAFLLGVWYFYLVAACFFFSVLLHEFGHVLAGRRFGQRSNVVLNGFGGVAVGAAGAFDRWQRVLVYAAGPIAQLLFGGALWLSNRVILHFCQTDEGFGEVVAGALNCLASINIFVAIVNLIPAWPLDGWHIAVEAYQWLRGWNRAPWEQNPDWWKGGGDSAEVPWEEGGDPGLLKSNRLPITLLVVSIALATVWSILDRYNPKTATNLVREFNNNHQAAMAWYEWRYVTFSAVLRKPPWEPALIQYKNGEKEALVYFETDNPGEWVFCIRRYQK